VASVKDVFEQHPPMHQFEIKQLIPIEIGGYDVSLTNSGAFMLAAVALITLFMTVATSKRSLVPGRLQSVAEYSYGFIANMLRDNVGTAGMPFFPFVFSLFLFILVANFLGMMPYSFTVTSHIIVTGAFALFIFFGVTLLGFLKHGIFYLKLFVPSGVPFLLLPIIVPIEIISYLSRPLSLSVRLFANMLAGHTMLKVFAGFVIALGIAGAGPLVVMVALTALEFLVAFLQAYVFAVLTCIYINDAIHMHEH
jgi:F-type H+-transporting ATPase subunit a